MHELFWLAADISRCKNMRSTDDLGPWATQAEMDQCERMEERCREWEAAFGEMAKTVGDENETRN